MTTQKRPLSGMVNASSGLTQPIKLAATATTVHTLGNVPSQQGGPFIDDITLLLSNSANAAKKVTLAFNGVDFAVVSLDANSVQAVFVDMPFASARDAAASVLTAAAETADVVFAFGWFARPL